MSGIAICDLVIERTIPTVIRISHLQHKISKADGSTKNYFLFEQSIYDHILGILKKDFSYVKSNNYSIKLHALHN